MCGSRMGGRVLAAFAVSSFMLAALFAASARADTLTDLRAKLASFDGQTPIHAALIVKTRTARKKENGGKPQTAEAQVGIQAGDGLSIHVEQATLRQAAAELAAASTNADHPTPTVALLNRSMGAVTLEHLLNEGPNLLRRLAPATAATAKSTTLWGRPAQEVTVTLPAPKSSEIKLKDFSDQFSVWLDAAGVPIAAAEQTQGKGCMLFLCMDVMESASYTLQIVARRLVATSLSTEHKQSGLGQDSDTHTIYTLQVQGAPAAAKTSPPAAVSKQG